MGNPIPHDEKPFCFHICTVRRLSTLLHALHECWVMAPSRVGSVPRKAEIIITSSLNNRTAVSTWMMGLDQNTHPFEGWTTFRNARRPVRSSALCETGKTERPRSHRAHRGAADSSVGGVRAPGSGFSGAAFRPPNANQQNLVCPRRGRRTAAPGARQGRPAHHVWRQDRGSCQCV